MTDGARPSRESMREVKREYKERRKAERKRARQGAGTGPRRARRIGPILGVLALVGIAAAAALEVLGVGPFAGPSATGISYAAATPTAAPSPSASPSASATPSPRSATVPPSASPTTATASFDPALGLTGVIAPAGGCLSEYAVNPDGGRRIASGSCSEPHAAEVVRTVAGGRLWTGYPTRAQRDTFDLACYLAAMRYLGYSGGDAGVPAYASRMLSKHHIGALAAFPAQATWPNDKGVVCALVDARGRDLPTGSLHGAFPS